MRDRPMADRIMREFHDCAYIIDAADPIHTIGELAYVLDQRGIETIYVVGGDGTFNNVINWIASLPITDRPRLMSVGGRQFCYMAKFHGLKNKNPLKNLRAIFSGKIRLVEQPWRPVRIHDSASDTVRHAAVVADGVINDMSSWYESAGKGGALKVFALIVLAIASVMSEWFRRRLNRIHLTSGTFVLGARAFNRRSYAGVTVSAIPRLLSSCQPFRGRLNPRELYCVAYWGGLRRLAFAAPFIWFGKEPFWIRRLIFNEPVRTASITTSDARLVLDGDLFRWPGTGAGREHTLTFSAGDDIPLWFVQP